MKLPPMALVGIDKKLYEAGAQFPRIASIMHLKPISLDEDKETCMLTDGKFYKNIKKL